MRENISNNLYTPQEFKVDISDDRIAQFPQKQREQSKLLVYNKINQSITVHEKFSYILDYLNCNLIVLNNTKVLNARVLGHKPSGGKVELLFVKTPFLGESGSEVHFLLNSSRRIQPNTELALPNDVVLKVLEKDEATSIWKGIWYCKGSNLFGEWLEQSGMPPLPPYIKRQVVSDDWARYQSVFSEVRGSLAAPTASLHFTKELLEEVALHNQVCKLTLNVGLGTFFPIKVTHLNEHKMHSESYDVPSETAELVNNAKAVGKKIFAVGTTVVRALEDNYLKFGKLTSGRYDADIFIRQPYQFQVVDGLITNFHRPDSTLIHLVAALIGWDGVNQCYQKALEEGFRFYSYGNAMLIV